MQITCPQCATTYRIPPDSLGAEGREVRCRQCAHVWHQYPEDYNNPPPPPPAPIEMDLITTTQAEPIVQPTDHIAQQEKENEISPRRRRIAAPKLAMPSLNLSSQLALLKAVGGTLGFLALILGMLAYYPGIVEEFSLHTPCLFCIRHLRYEQPGAGGCRAEKGRKRIHHRLRH